MSEVEVMSQPAKEPARARKRTPKELVARVETLESVMGARGWCVSVVVDNLPSDVAGILSAPNDSNVAILAGPAGGATAITERYQLIKESGNEAASEGAATMSQMTAFLKLQYRVTEETSLLAIKSIQALSGTVDQCANMAKKATKAVGRQFKAQKQLKEAREEADGGLGGIFAEVAAILGPEKTSKLLSDMMSRFGGGKEPKEKKPAPKRKAPKKAKKTAKKGRRK